jgi:hypothetical protein
MVEIELKMVADKIGSNTSVNSTKLLRNVVQYDRLKISIRKSPELNSKDSRF